MAATVHDSAFLSRRVTVLGAIIALHIVVIYAIASGLASRAINLVAPPIQTEIVEEVQKRDTPPPPPPPEFERPPVEVPPPDVTIDIPTESQTTAITNTTTQHVAPVAAPPPVAHKVVNASINGKNFPNSEDYYPAASKRLGEEGSPVVHVCIGAGGKLTEEPTIATTSGSARLDEGAVKLAKAGRYIQGSSDGQPVTQCINFRVKFELKG